MRTRTHPGEILREEFLKPHKMTPHALALAIGVSSSRISEICKEIRGVSPETAARLARFFGTTAQFWLNLQNAYDLSIIEEKKARELQRIIPYRETVCIL